MGRITAFIIGGLAGACAALVFAPKTGEQMRACVVDQVSVCKDKVQDMMGQDPQQVYQEVVGSATGFAQEAAGQVAGKVQEIKTGTKPEDDELRQKIEAARQRIAEQVAKNIEESRAAVEETAEAVVEAVEEAAEEQSEEQAE